ncbi:MAG: hypothetical protein KAY32_05055, partial [Candidatus Eisenbacteria sp.]|nr:hypothetical protein [Candidatus Eisenbacteria bacterium]
MAGEGGGAVARDPRVLAAGRAEVRVRAAGRAGARGVFVVAPRGLRFLRGCPAGAAFFAAEEGRFAPRFFFAVVGLVWRGRVGRDSADRRVRVFFAAARGRVLIVLTSRG